MESSRSVLYRCQHDCPITTHYASLAGQNKYIFKVVSKKYNDYHFQRYESDLDVFLKTRRDSELEEIDKGKNVGFRVHDQGIAVYKQHKLGLSAYCDKRG